MRICFTLNVRPDRIAEYKKRHAEVWPEMLVALRETGWQNYSLFLRADGLLVGYFEADSFEACLAAMKARAVNDRWQEWMSSMFVGPEPGAADDNMIPLEEVFYLK